MRLRGKLIAAFTVLVSLPLAVGLTSLVISQGMRRAVAELRPRLSEDLHQMDIGHAHLEIEGYRAGDVFVATEVAVAPGLRRPKLRGAIEAIDHERQSLHLLGVDVLFDSTPGLPGRAAVEAADADKSVLQDLSVGQRVEVSASLVDGTFVARKIRTAHVKDSDQIKGTPTGIDLGEPPGTIAFGDFVVSLSRENTGSPQGALRQVELATQMTLEIQEVRAAAHALFGGTLIFEDLQDRDGSAPAQRLVASEAAFEHYLQVAQGGTELPGASLPPARGMERLATLASRLPRFREIISTLVALEDDPDRARIVLERELEPFLQNDLLPIIYRFRGESEETLAEQIGDIARGSETTTRVAMATSALAVVMAIVLCIALWRAIGVPIRALHEAALDVGKGRFDVRVETRSSDEFGELAGAFNDMASELAATTISVRSLESIFDSMSAVLLLLDGAGRITNVNRAAVELLGYAREDLVGLSLSAVCASPGDERTAGGGDQKDGIATSGERRFRRPDGAEVAVSFSGAELRSQGGPQLGYVCVAQDLRDRKRIEQRLRASVEEKDLLLREVHHRVKNNMQVISSLLAVQASYVRDPSAAREFEESQNRIRSMALIHEQLYRETHLSDIDLRGYLGLLSSQLLESYGIQGIVRIELDVDEITLGIDQALACGLLVNELVTNSLKHACRLGGTIHITVTALDSGTCVLRVSDDGPGLSATAGPGGLGLSLVTTLAKQLQGQLRFGSAAGAEIEITFPTRAMEFAS